MPFNGVPGVFGPWVQACARHLAERVTGFVDPKSRHYGAVATTIDEFADLWLPARAFVPERPREFLDEAAGCWPTPTTPTESAWVGVQQLRPHDRDRTALRQRRRAGTHLRRQAGC